MSQSGPIVPAPQGSAGDAGPTLEYQVRQGARKASARPVRSADHLQVLAQLRYLIDNPKAPAPFRSRVLAEADALLETA
jgi:hypothetical protein